MTAINFPFCAVCAILDYHVTVNRMSLDRKSTSGLSFCFAYIWNRDKDINLSAFYYIFKYFI